MCPITGYIYSQRTKYLNTAESTSANCYISTKYLVPTQDVDWYIQISILTLMKFLRLLVYHEVFIYYYINVPIIYWVPDINKWIANMWIKTLYLEFTTLDYFIFQFSKNLHFSSWDIDINIIVLHVRQWQRHI